MRPTGLRRAAATLRRGGLVAYPTESVFGLGCDPRNRAAVQRLLKLKCRPARKGLILIAATVPQLAPYASAIPDDVRATWPGPRTWLLPAHRRVPFWLRGRHDRIALRVTAHPVAAALCRAAGMAIVSTSANPGGQRPARTTREVARRFGRQIDCILPGRVGRLRRPTPITDAVTKQVIRAG